MGFFCSAADTSLFISHHSQGTILLLLYVDDIILTKSNPHSFTRLINLLGSEFAMKDMGPLHYFIGVEVTNFGVNMFLNQTKYAIDLLKRAQMTGCKAISTPMVTKMQLRINRDEAFLDLQFYQSIVGDLKYLTSMRPDIAFSVNYVCQYMH